MGGNATIRSALLVIAGAAVAVAIDTTPTTGYLNQKLDHFNSSDSRRWQHRFLMSDEHWGRGDGIEGSDTRMANGCKGPILIYTGNEGAIEGFWGSNGFMIDRLAPKFNALLLFPEERYYGESLPFGADSFTAANLQYLSTEQILADYAALIEYFQEHVDGAAGCPVVAFGGSFGGTLATFFRLTYPHLVLGSLASSAPIGYYDPDDWQTHGVDHYTWIDIVLKVWGDAGCMQPIMSAISQIQNAPSDKLISDFHVCSEDALGTVKSDLFVYVLESLPQLDYPPSWPINATCAKLMQADDLIKVAGEITSSYLGFNGKDCIQKLAEGPGGVPGDGPGPGSWGWQSCTENVHEFSAHGFRNYTFDINNIDSICKHLFNNTVMPDPMSLSRTFGGYKIPGNITNIIWSNGLRDPWHGGGFLTPSGNIEDNYWIIMPNGAHHVDLRGPSPADPDDIIAARDKEESIIAGWLAKFEQNL